MAQEFVATSMLRPRSIQIVPAARVSGIAREVAIAAWVVRVSDNTAVVMFDLHDGAVSGAGALDGTVDGCPLPRPVQSCRLPLRRGGIRCLVHIRQPAEALARSRIDLALGGAPTAFVNPDWLQSPLREAEDLAEGLCPDAAPRFLRFLLSSVGAIIGGNDAASFATCALRLLTALDIPRVLPSVCVTVGHAGAVVGFQHGSAGSQVPATVVLLGRSATRVLTRVSAHADHESTHLFLPAEAVDSPCDVVCLGPSPRHLVLGASTKQDLGDWLDNISVSVRAWGVGWLRLIARADPQIGALLIERAVPREAMPSITASHVARTNDGLLVAANLSDARRVAARVGIVAGDWRQEVDVPTSGWLRFHLSVPPGAALPKSKVRFDVHGHSGSVLATATADVSRFTGSVPPGFADPGNDVDGSPDPSCASAIRAIAAAWPGRGRFVPEVGCPGIVAGHADVPRLSIVVPVSSKPDIIRARAAIVAAEPAGHEVEIDMLVSGRPSQQLNALLALVASTCGIRHRTVSMPTVASAADRLVAALAVARAQKVLCLGPDVLPERHGWLNAWIDAITGLSAGGILGGVLVGPDMSVLHAGGRLQMHPTNRRFTMVHASRGLPATDLGAMPCIRSDLFSTEAVGLGPAGREAVVTAGACLPDPDLALLPALLRSGGGRVYLAHKFVCYGSQSPSDAFARAASLHILGDAGRRPDGSVGADDLSDHTTPGPALDATITHGFCGHESRSPEPVEDVAA